MAGLLQVAPSTMSSASGAVGGVGCKHNVETTREFEFLVQRLSSASG